MVTNKERITELYMEENMNARQISEELGCSMNSVSATIYSQKLNKKREEKIHRELDKINEDLIQAHLKFYGTTKVYIKTTKGNYIRQDLRDMLA